MLNIYQQLFQLNMYEESGVDKTSKTTGYDVDSIQIHHGLDGIRVRPTMYLGDYGEPMLFQMQKEIIDNAIDEKHAGRNNYVSVICNTKTNETIVYDRGNGIPVGDSKDGINTLVAVFSMVHAGGKFNDKAYAKSAGTFGTGAAAVNAVSNRFIVWTKWNNQWYSVGFKQGKLTNPVQTTTGVPTAITQRIPNFNPDRGTVVYFLPDIATISDPSGENPAKVNLKTLGTYLRTASFMNPKLVIDFRSETHGKTMRYVSENGVSDLVAERVKNEGLDLLTKSFVLVNDKISLCLSWSNSENDDGIWSYVNGSRTIDGGKHFDGVVTLILGL
jgi:DNA gyrase subunit B